MGRVLGIEIGYSLIKICETDLKSKNPKVHKGISIMSPVNIIDDGMLTVTDELADLLRETLKKNKIRTKQVVFSVSSTKIASREVIIPEIKENKIQDLVETNASDYFPMDVGQYRLSYSILDTAEAENGSKKMKLLILATPSQLIDSYKELAEKCGLQVIAIDYNGNSIYQMIHGQCSEDVGMIIKADERMTFLIILKDGKIIMQRTVAYGVDEAVNALLGNKNYFTYIEAVNELRTTEYLGKTLEDTDYVLEGELKKEITGALEYLIRGISRVLDYYNSKEPQDTVKRIYVTGIGGEFRNFDVLCSNELGIQTEVLRGAEGSGVAKAFSVSDKDTGDCKYLGDYLACIGAAIAPIWMAAEEKKQKKARNAGTDLDKISIAALCLGAAAAICLTAFSFASQRRYENEQDMLNSGIEELKTAEAVYNKYKYIQTLNSDADTIEAQSANSNNNLKNFIEEMEKRLPSDTTVVSLTSTTDSITISINVETKASAAAIIAEFRKFDSVSTVETVGLTDLVNDAGYREVNFTVNCVYDTAVAEDEGEA